MTYKTLKPHYNSQEWVQHPFRFVILSLVVVIALSTIAVFLPTTHQHKQVSGLVSQTTTKSHSLFKTTGTVNKIGGSKNWILS